ncbi:MAG: 16S rRNA (uracil(1498)-N(3))-methyltransferase [Treponema sp.]|nr:16S rRNA (uracil(1498)-N(3))-methyltransferase [Treponema sp.]
MRQYVAQIGLSRDGTLSVSGKDYRYMKQVLRLAVGDMVDVRLPSGSLQPMTVCRIDDRARAIMLQVCAETAPAEPAGADLSAASAEPSVVFWLFQFIARSAKMDVIIRQATECGVQEIFPVISDFSQAGAKERNFRGDRYERIIKEARQQSGSAVATQVREALSFEEALSLWKERCASAGEAGACGFVLYERTEQTLPLYTAISRAQNRAPDGVIRHVALVCGAEGGISPAELNRLVQEGFVPIHFKTNILRCETAALYGIAALQTALAEGDVWQCRE